MSYFTRSSFLFSSHFFFLYILLLLFVAYFAVCFVVIVVLCFRFCFEFSKFLQRTERGSFWFALCFQLVSCRRVNSFNFVYVYIVCAKGKTVLCVSLLLLFFSFVPSLLHGITIQIREELKSSKRTKKKKYYFVSLLITTSIRRDFYHPIPLVFLFVLTHPDYSYFGIST